jgi:starch synthase
MSGIRVLFCAPEVSPYAKTGGLADVVGALPPALKQLGCDARIFVPLYRTARPKVGYLRSVAEDVSIPVGVHSFNIHIWEGSTLSGIPVYFLEKDEFYDRTYLYGVPSRGDYQDNAERFITFSRAVYSLCMELSWFPDIFHLHDWQTGLISAYHNIHWRNDPSFARSGTVFTIHNLAYQGIVPGVQFSLTHLPAQAFSLRGLEFWGQCNFLKAGLVFSDFLTTVSPHYSEEIQHPEFGSGLDGILRERSDRLVGILNGVDYDTWSPETDRLIPACYSASDLTRKKLCKKALLSKLKFPSGNLDTPLLAMISRLASQKGFDLLVQVLEDLMSLQVRMVILGTGDSEIESRLKEAAKRHPTQLKVVPRFDERLAHWIEAGADIFLMPSHYEPCGLNQMYSLRYGTVPVVHATGGLEDSVTDVLQRSSEGTGFKFYEYAPGPFLEAVKAAVGLFQDTSRWLELQRRGMTQDFSWNRSARHYLDIYEKVKWEKHR